MLRVRVMQHTASMVGMHVILVSRLNPAASDFYPGLGIKLNSAAAAFYPALGHITEDTILEMRLV